MMNISTGAAQAYAYIVNLSGVAVFIVWASISFMHIRFRQAWALHNRDVNDLPYKSLWYPVNAYFGLIANVFLAIVQGWTTLAPFNAGNFVDAYILLPLFPTIWIVFKYFTIDFTPWPKPRFGKRTNYVKIHEMDIDSGRRVDLDKDGMKDEESDEGAGVGGPKKKLSLWRRVWNWF